MVQSIPISSEVAGVRTPFRLYRNKLSPTKTKPLRNFTHRHKNQQLKNAVFSIFIFYSTNKMKI